MTWISILTLTEWSRCHFSVLSPKRKEIRPCLPPAEESYQPWRTMYSGSICLRMNQVTQQQNLSNTYKSYIAYNPQTKGISTPLQTNCKSLLKKLCCSMTKKRRPNAAVAATEKNLKRQRRGEVAWHTMQLSLKMIWSLILEAWRWWVESWKWFWMILALLGLLICWDKVCF